MSYRDFFLRATQFRPYPFQEALARAWPDLLDIPTGLGKTAAVLGAWLYRRLQGDAPRRLVYCLPMRVLVEQTAEVARGMIERIAQDFEEGGHSIPRVFIEMGGDADDSWDEEPESATVIIGTQDLLLSRALNRGFAMSRYRWPIQFGLLNDDCIWVMDETQLMGVGVETTAQLQGLRGKLGTFAPAHSIWMSATLGERQLSTVDHRRPADGWNTLSIGPKDLELEAVQKRITAKKSISKVAKLIVEKEDDPKYAKTVAEKVAKAHQPGSLTLVFVNRVDRARSIFEELKKTNSPAEPVLVHSRFRPADRSGSEQLIQDAEADRIVVTTQALEAGVDIDALTLFTELAPWPSLVQRLGRCNRCGEADEAQVFWIDINEEKDKGRCALPYDAEDLNAARELLKGLEDGGPGRLREVAFDPPPIIRPVLRRKDLMELFDTTQDISGNDVDVSPYIRDEEDLDVKVYWRNFEESPAPGMEKAFHDELCSVSIPAMRTFLETRRKSKSSPFFWDALERKWNLLRRNDLRPGLSILLQTKQGGYLEELGWTGDVKHQPSEVSNKIVELDRFHSTSMDGNDETAIDRWVELIRHLDHVESISADLSKAIGLDEDLEQALRRGARWHDVGKAHTSFQEMLLEPLKTDQTIPAPPREDAIWAKSAHNKGRCQRRFFRHELGSALAWWSANADDPHRDLIAFLIASHHGKVRLSIRSLPGEHHGENEDRLFARGWIQGDVIPAVDLPGGERTPATSVDLSPMVMGQGSWLDRMLQLRDSNDLGPFRLALLEAIIRSADRRASRDEQRGEME